MLLGDFEWPRQRFGPHLTSFEECLLRNVADPDELTINLLVL